MVITNQLFRVPLKKLLVSEIQQGHVSKGILTFHDRVNHMLSEGSHLYLVVSTRWPFVSEYASPFDTSSIE